jgi:hypothetical protein
MSWLHLGASILRGTVAPIGIPARVLKAAFTAGAKAGFAELTKASAELATSGAQAKMIGHSYPYGARAGGSSAVLSLIVSSFLAGTYAGPPLKDYARELFNSQAAAPSHAVPPPLPAAGSPRP